MNSELAHRFLGSTEPDKQGRSVTSRQKSYTTACHHYSTIVEHLDRYLFEDMPTTPHGLQRSSAAEKEEWLTGLFGNAGVVNIQNMDDFLIATSVPIERDIQIDPRRGVRYLGRTYVSAELLHCIRMEKPTDKRRDCVDPYRMYVRFKSKWVLATTADNLKSAGRSDFVKLFESMTDATFRSENARIKSEKRIERALRTDEANLAAKATQHLVHMIEKGSEPKKSKNVARWSTREERISPFLTEEEK